MALSTVAFAFPPGTRPATGIVGYLQAVSAIVAVTLGGHGGSTETWPLSFAGTAIHLYAAAVWLGGVSFLIVVLPKITRLDRWHRVAGAHVLLVIAAGAILAMIQVRPIQALVTTVYGVVLLGKIALVVSAVAAGYLTYRRYLDCSTLGHDGGGEVALRRPRVLLVEAGLASAVLAATSVLSSVTPAEDSYTTDVRTELDFGASGILDVEIDSIRRGPQSLTVRFAIPAGYDPSAELSGVEVYLSSVEANVTRMAVDLTRTGPDDDQITWESDGLIVPAAGEWTVTVRFESLGGPKLASFDYVVL
ncbi:copper resistance D family protein [Rhodococcus zopfii]|uniref:copper resistance D family protein n=1 Tax=Rhodococcus zopfii TaxID=43772 RepID=UPI003527A8FB